MPGSTKPVKKPKPIVKPAKKYRRVYVGPGAILPTKPKKSGR